MLSDSGAYELILGSSVDAQFGPVLLFGAGGSLAEVQKDYALGLPPLTSVLAARVMERTSIFRALKGVRGRPPVDLAELQRILVRFGQLITEQPQIGEIEVNPLLVSHERIVGLDARVLLHSGEHIAPAIRPYPSQYVSQWRILDAAPVTIRPIRPDDEPLIVKFHGALSERSVYFRYFSTLKLSERISHARLVRTCFSDYARDIALVADHKHPQSNAHEILGVGRLSRMHNSNDAEFALLVADAWQGHGLGTRLLQMLIHVARAEKLDRLIGRVHSENTRMQQLCRELGFTLKKLPDEPEYLAELTISKT
jgi:acetyltransferase